MIAPTRMVPAASRRWLSTLGAAAVLAAVASGRAENILPNGGFDHDQGGLFGWITDYAWTGNKHYVGNKDRVSVRGGAAHIKADTDAGAKIECVPIPLEPGFRYTATLEIEGGPYRVYFAGYKWKPGVRPHESPELGELRMIYKGRAASAAGGSRSKVKVELPGVKLTDQARANLKQVRFITLYVWIMKEGSVDNVTLTRTADPAMKF